MNNKGFEEMGCMFIVMITLFICFLGLIITFEYSDIKACAEGDLTECGEDMTVEEARQTLIDDWFWEEENLPKIKKEEKIEGTRECQENFTICELGCTKKTWGDLNECIKKCDIILKNCI